MTETGTRDGERERKLNRKRRKKDCTKNPNAYGMITCMPFYKITFVNRNVKRKTF